MYLRQSVYRTLGPCSSRFRFGLERNRPPAKGRPIYLTYRRACSVLVKKEPHTSANQVLPQITTLVRIDLGARVIEVVVFDKRGPLLIEKVIRAGNHVPRQVRMTLPPARVDRRSASCWILNLDARRFCEVNANPGPGIRLELPSRRPKSQNEVKHKGARINPCSHVARCQKVTVGIPQGKISAAPET